MADNIDPLADVVLEILGDDAPEPAAADPAPTALRLVEFPRLADDLIDEIDPGYAFKKLALGGHDGKQVLGNVYNAGLIMSRDQRLVGLVGYDEFRERVYVMRDIDAGGDCVPRVRIKGGGEPLKKYHVDALMAFMQAPCEIRGVIGGHGCNVTRQAAESGISNAARQNPFDPVKILIEQEEWDGVPRLDTWISRYLGCPDDVYHQEVGRKWMVGAVTRVYEPGAKFDFILTVLGHQGAKKSSLFKVLGGEFYSSMGSGAMKDEKRLIEATTGKWIVEVAEMAAMQGATQDSVKNILSTTSDIARLAYDKDSSDRQRRFVFAATTNRVDMLDDPTGGRRYWIVETTKTEENPIDTDTLEVEVAQMWAEALHLYREMRAEKPAGDLPLYLSADSTAIAKKKQGSSVSYDDIEALADEIRTFFETPRLDGDEEAYGYLYYGEVAPKEIFAGITGKPVEEYAGGKLARDILKACRRIEYLRASGDRRYIKRIKEKAKSVIVDREKFLPHFASRLRDVEGEIIEDAASGVDGFEAGGREEKLAGAAGEIGFDGSDAAHDMLDDMQSL